MEYSKDEIMQYIAEEDVKFIRLAFTDVFGRQKNISIMPDEVERAFDTGIAFDASAISGFGDESSSDLFLHPDSSTITVLPWRPEHGRVVRMFCSIKHPDGTPFEADARAILKNAVEDAKREGVSFSFGTEMEFYLFKRDENGEPTKAPYDNAGYMDIAPDDKGENVRREICLTLERMGIKPESSHHEQGPGQNEIDFKYSDPLTSADNAVTFRSVVSTIAARNGLFADFSPKPLDGHPGNGMHMNMSARLIGGGELMPMLIAGILANINDMTVFLNPVDDSYKRFGELKAPKYISWSKENRSALIRVPAAVGKFKRLELRSPDPMCNPYLAHALMIRAGLYGIRNKIELPESADINFYTLPQNERDKYIALPKSLAEAKTAAAVSGFINECLPKRIIDCYTD